ncbi:replication initiation and membrane attachment family protein [Anoxybacteroides amylolyticum]|uniref:Replication initiation and membrane attachment family protein n=1 Tax=Anoxybacteroides amylolyticum TaxID=294699 RepID=A0A160F7Q7_9BACL|nr:replication initiation and membrane attachment family protein [Anoxybacillus amylolyticus]ANB62322.1 replication initiation and membrane attachment family protein [Anoxybacillus amylolyticus]
MEHHWKELIPVDRYIVRSNGMLHDFDRKVITLLYQPLIGSRAFSLYMTLWGELDQQFLTAETTHHSLMAIMQCNLKDIYEERLKLEGIGLLKTYVNRSKDPNQFIYELQPPLSPEKFFNDGMLNVFLYNRVGRTKFQKLKQFFSIPALDTQHFSPITRSFNEVFASVHPEQMVATMNEEAKNDLSLPQERAYLDRSTETYVLGEEVFDFELFFAGLSKQIVPKRAITAKVREAIKKLSFLYGISPLEMQKLVMDVIDPTEHIDIEALRKAARDWYQFERGDELPHLSTRVQPFAYRTMIDVEPKTKEEQLMKQLETISPRQLLMEISGGAEPSMSDLQLIEDIMFQQKLLPGVVNVLIYYVMLRTDMKLSKAYVEKIASHWARKKIRTVKEAMELAKKEAQKYQSWATDKEKKPARKTVRKEMLPDWLNMDYSQKESEQTPSDLEAKRRELEERLKKYRNE